jgi:hypothetical protein
MALKKGRAMVEFYSLLPVLKSRYKIQMSYEQFNIYFKRELSKRIEPILTPKKEAKIPQIK